jgi:erythromycin esterase-like protein
MSMIAVELKVSDYTKWRPMFEKNKPLRDKAGFKGTHVFRDADNANEIIVWSEVADLAKARAALASHEIRAAMHEAGVIGAPKIHVLD